MTFESKTKKAAGKKSKTEETPDSVPWIVRATDGKQIGESYTSAAAAISAAKRYTDATGQYAGAVRK